MQVPVLCIVATCKPLKGITENTACYAGCIFILNLILTILLNYHILLSERRIHYMNKEHAIHFLRSSGFSYEQIKNIEKAFSNYVPIVTPLAPHQKIMTHIISDIKDYEKNCVSGCSDDPNCVECLKTVFENIYSIFDGYNKEGGME